MSTLSWIIFVLLVATGINFCLLLNVTHNMSKALRLIHQELNSQRERIRTLETRP